MRIRTKTCRPFYTLCFQTQLAARPLNIRAELSSHGGGDAVLVEVSGDFSCPPAPRTLKIFFDDGVYRYQIHMAQH